SEERWQLAIKGNNDGIWDWKINIGKTFISTRYKEILGYKNHEIVFYFDEWKRHVHPNDLERVIAATQDYLDQKSPYYHVEYRLRCKDGTYKWVMSRGQALWDEEGKPVRMVGSTKDISRRKRAEEKLRNSKAHLVVAQRVAHVGSWEVDILTQKIIWSEEMFRIFGLDSTKLEPTYAEYIQLIHPDDRAVWEQFVGKAIADGTFYEVDFRIVRPDGEIRYVEGRGETIANEAGQVKRLFGTVIDITERKQAEEALRASEAREREKAQELELALSQLKRTQAQLIQAEKMSSLGRTIAGVAHEINNPVGFISCNLTHARAYFQDLLKLMELYQQTYPKPTPAIERLTKKIELNFLIEDWVKLMDSMQMGSERIRQIVLSLRNFSRLDEKELKPVDIHEGIDNTLLILQHQMRSVGVSKAGRDSGLHQAIEVIKDYGQLPKVTCYASQLNQVFMNLLSNAIDALKTQPSPRKITISTSVASHHWSVVNGNKQQTTNYVVIRIADNGPGISEEVLPKIFDPFFTTKPVGSGTGLGLSISYQIVVETHKGQIRCISALGQGTEMIIEIPVNCDSEAGRHQAEG
ncbi:MAG TPA: hypothetical protein DCE56_03625, partial [Cyanobacteria bacterium UBA8553]|nr:hypothetical protein [Cyanobacteria bacterium UBA8553]